MTESSARPAAQRLRGWGLSEQHLMPEAVVAFVDGELGPAAHDRAAEHIARCPACAEETAAQRQASSAVRAADPPMVPAGLLASLCAIPDKVELPGSPDGLAVTDDGQLVTVQRPDRVGAAPFGSSRPLGSSTRLGEGGAVLGRRTGRRAAQSAGVVVSGLVLGALALVNTGAGPTAEDRDEPPVGVRPAVVGGGAAVQPVGRPVDLVPVDSPTLTQRGELSTGLGLMSGR